MKEATPRRLIAVDDVARLVALRLREWLDSGDDHGEVPEAMTTAQVARAIGRTPRRVGQLVQEGKLRAAREIAGADGRAYRVFAREDVLAYLAARDGKGSRA